MSLHRRALLLAAITAPLAAPGLRAQAPEAPRLILLSDLHSAQERAAATLALVDRARPDGATVIAINGDVFERGNAIALRSAGAADWAFLAALRRRAPVVLNIGNHEGALVDDIEETVRRARAADIAVLSTLRRKADGTPIADAAVRIDLTGGRRLAIIGIATNEAGTYRAPVRARLDFPDPAAWAAAELPGLVAGGDAVVVLSHAGVVADRAILPLLPAGTLLAGGHEHLAFAHEAPGLAYVHTGSWNRFVTVATLRAGAAPAHATLPVDPAQGEDAAHAALWRDIRAAHGRPEDDEVLFRLPGALPLGQAARAATVAIARATGSTAGVIAHTSFGTGLPAGPVTRLDFDAFLRFDGALFRGAADDAAMARIAARANQDTPTALAARIGDFPYADPLPRGAADLAANGWVRLNAERYLGAPLPMAEVPGLRLKAVVAAALAG